MQVYKITNLINSKIYVGYETHQNKYYYGSGHLIIKAIKTYGKENFKKEILEECKTKEELCDREKYWIEKLNCRNRKIGYNIHKGGGGAETGKFLGNKNPMYRKTVYSIWVEKYGMEEANKKLKESNTKKSNSMQGRKNSKESIEKVRISALNRKKVNCKFCEKLVSVNTVNRWHNDNCKFKKEVIK